MKSNKQIAIGILITAFAFLAIAAFPPQWNSGQFRSTGGVFSHLPNGNLGTNQTVYGTSALTLTNNNGPVLALEANTGFGASIDFTFGGGSPEWQFAVDEVSLNVFADPIVPLTIYRTGGRVEFSTGITNKGWYHGTGILTNVADIKTDGNLIVTTAGKGLQIKEGSNAKMGKVTLVSGSATVSTTAFTANSRVFLTASTNGTETALGDVKVGNKTPGTSFEIIAAELAAGTGVETGDTSDVFWMIVEPSP